jgi:hypothetical protein
MHACQTCITAAASGLQLRFSENHRNRCFSESESESPDACQGTSKSKHMHAKACRNHAACHMACACACSCHPDSCAGVSTDTFFQGEMTVDRGLRGTNVPAKHKQSLKYNDAWLGWRPQACPTHPNKPMAKRHQNRRMQQRQNPRGNGNIANRKLTDCRPPVPSRST